MRVLNSLDKVQVDHWARSGYLLHWFGKAATDMGLTGKAEPLDALGVLRDGIAPNGEKLATLVAGRYEQADGQTCYPPLAVSFFLRFCPHESADELFLYEYRAAMAAHEAAVEAALLALEKHMELGLVGVKAMCFNEFIKGYWPRSKPANITTEAVFAASGRDPVDWRGWRPLGTVHEVLETVLPASQAALAAYQLCLGKELAVNLEVGVTYQSSPENNTVPVAVFKQHEPDD